MDWDSNRLADPAHRVVSERVLARGRAFSFVELEVASPHGRYTNQIVRHPGAVTILAVTGDPDPRVVFVENYRASVDWRVLELPAGKLDKGEDPRRCAHRELIEETGYEAGRIEPLGEVLTSPGLTDERMDLFLARDLQQVGARPEDDEDLIVRTIPVDSCLDMARRGQIEDAKSALTILLAHAQGKLDPAGGAS